MTTTPQRPATAGRTLLSLTPVGGKRHGSRDLMTCKYKCGNACDAPLANVSGNPHIAAELTKVVKRRSLLRAGGAGALVLGGLASAATGGAAAAAPAVGAGAAGGAGAVGRPGTTLATTGFRSVAPNRRDAVTTADGFDHDVLISWGDKVEAGAPAFDVHHQTVEAARQQFGYNNDYVGVLPIPGRKKRALLVTNHEYTDEELMYPTGAYTAEEVLALNMSYHGMSVVEIRQGLVPGSWLRVEQLGRAQYNRRVHIATEFRFDGAAAGSELLRTAADPTGTRVLGTIANCAGGTTPWGTVLSGEENFNNYFDASGDLPAEYAEQNARYGITGSGSNGWSAVDERFDVTLHPHEPHRFGWVVELDPFMPGSRPVKHTMLGRLKHEGANVSLSKDGHAVVYMGDDERGDYLYKFVSRDTFVPGEGRRARRHNKTLLSAGTLYVAVLTGDGSEDGLHDGTGVWLPLTSDTESYVDGMSVEEVLVFTRLAADTVGATAMDRPEDVEPNPVNGRIYAALTNNSKRGTTFAADEANPLTTSMVRSALGEPLTEAAGNRNGYVLEITPDGRGRGDHAATTFTWDLMLICGDPEAEETWFAGYDKSLVSPISCPDNVAFDSVGNLWIATDGNALGSNDGIFRVPVAGDERGHVKQFVTMPYGSEACGPLVADDDRSLFFAVQHPGEVDGSTFESQASTWPHTDDFPRPSVCVAFRRA
ncbi:PhoX family phosphatase [Nocardioides sp. GY 10127]|uniref:PhoX family protein n=1 Tax=Nocardioides sp. GY 10127 TaxID=2569762 RepID=UPI0010A9027D|nr:PhoX family phosphatase [Nocardioides sp. GY 10127]TIC84003.1 PhoX family phosphatase [Nocardioides sp. GY 10127]